LLSTWQWLAPEVIDSQRKLYDERSDVYSFGMVCWELITGDAPFDELYHIAENVNQYGKLYEQRIKQEIINQHLRPTIPDECPHEFALLIRDCWKANPAHRPSFPAIVQWLADLGGFADTIERTASLHVVATKSAEVVITPPCSPTARSRVSTENEFATQLLSLPKTAYCFVVVYDSVWVGCSDGTLAIFSQCVCAEPTSQSPD
jgi:serine/threonine protein kinase